MKTRPKEYVHKLTPEDLTKSPNSDIQKLAENKFCESADQTKEEGLASLNGTGAVRGGRKIILNGNQIEGEIGFDQLDKALGKQGRNFLRHYSQMVGYYAAVAPMSVPREARSLSEVGKQKISTARTLPPGSEISESKVEINWDETTKRVTVTTTVLLPLRNLPVSLDEESKNKVDEVQSVVELIPESEQKDEYRGFKLLRISMNTDLVCDLYAGEPANLRASFNASDLDAEEKPLVVSRWERFKEMYDEVSTGSKWAAGIAITLGVAAIIVGAVFFPPLLFVTLPLVGKVAGASLLVYGGAALAGVAVLGHTVDIFKDPFVSAGQRFENKWRAISPERKWAAGIAITLGVAAIITGVIAAVFFPPSLILTLPLIGKVAGAAFASSLMYGGLGLAGVTALGHIVDILRQPLKSDNKPPEQRRGSESFSDFEYGSRSRESSISGTNNSVRRTLERHPNRKQAAGPSSRVPSGSVSGSTDSPKVSGSPHATFPALEPEKASGESEQQAAPEKTSRPRRGSR